MLTDEQLQEIEARCEAASDGPWATFPEEHDFIHQGRDKYGRLSASIMMEKEQCKFAECSFSWDAVFIAHARTDIPALLAHIRELEAEKAHRERALYFQSSRMVKHFRGNMLCCSDKQCADDGGCIECLTAQALAATKESPCPK